MRTTNTAQINRNACTTQDGVVPVSHNEPWRPWLEQQQWCYLEETPAQFLLTASTWAQLRMCLITTAARSSTAQSTAVKTHRNSFVASVVNKGWSTQAVLYQPKQRDLASPYSPLWESNHKSRRHFFVRAKIHPITMCLQMPPPCRARDWFLDKLEHSRWKWNKNGGIWY